jgi:SAM-dependent methyltransferase
VTATPAEAAQPAFWQAYLPSGYRDYRFPPGARVLDVGCGEGNQLLKLREAGHQVVGVEPWREVFPTLRAHRLAVAAGVAEALPIRSASCGAVLCKVVTPLTEERKAIAELGRVLRPGGLAYVIHHGAGFYLRYLLQAPKWQYRVYAVRGLVNSWFYALTGVRLPGWLGDTIYQSARRLRRAYGSAGLTLVEREPSRRFLGFPVFIADRLRRDA